MITIVIVDDHKIMRQGIRLLLENESDFQVVGEAATGLDGWRIIQEERPDVLITDLSMEGLNGIQLCQKVRQSALPTSCIVLSAHNNESYVIESIRAGARGYVLKEKGYEDVVNAVRAVAAHRMYLSRPLDHKMADLCSRPGIFEPQICQMIQDFASLPALEANLSEGAPTDVPASAGEPVQTAPSLEAQIKVLRELALMDELTGAGNRRYANNSLLTKLEELKRHGWPFGVILFDIDDMKPANDQYGHAAGDQVLKSVALTVGRSIRSQNSYFFRWGGDEFLIIASNVTAKSLLDLSERIRRLVSNTPIRAGGQNLQVSISSGAAMAMPEDTPESLIRRVDDHLYTSKKEGRNRST